MKQMSRRGMLQAAGIAVVSAASVSGMAPLGRIDGAQAATLGLTPPPGLPAGVTTYLQTFRNWAGEIVTDGLWSCSVTSPQQVADIANWGATNGWKVRPRGFMHGWSPLTVKGNETRNNPVLLVDTKQGLTEFTVVPGSPASVTVGTGVALESLLERVYDAGYGIVHHPAPGDITVGGALAIGGHGTGIPAEGETKASGESYGSMSNLVRWIEAVVWDAAAGKYVVKGFSRTDPACAPLLCHVGRAFITRVNLALGPRATYRCRSYTNVPTAELLGRPGSTGRTLDSYLKATGRVEIIHFPYTTYAWLKTWQKTATKPTSAKAVTSPYNFTFADNPGSLMESLFSTSLSLNPSSVTTLGPTQLSAVQSGLSGGLSDLWGPGPDTMLYVRPTTLKVTANGYAVLCRRADVQRAVNEFWNYYKSLNSKYQLFLQFPINGPIEIRVTGVDNPADSGVYGAVDPALSPSRRRADHPEWDTVVWFDVLTMPRTSGSNSYYAEMERWFYSNYSSYACVRVEWSKGWGYTSSGGWSDSNAFGTRIPASFGGGGMTLQQTADALDAFDPKRIFSAPIHDRLLP